jgi:hypothetical protein
MLDRLFIKATEWLFYYGERRRARAAGGFMWWWRLTMCLISIAFGVAFVGLLIHMGTQR